MPSGRRNDDDDQLFAELADALRIREIAELGKAAYTWRTVDAEIAALAYDSAHDRELAPTTRAEAAFLRALTFASSELTIELEVTANGLQGQLVPIQSGQVQVQGTGGEILVTAEVDETGYFIIRPQPRGGFRLRCRTTEGRIVLTNLISL
jgi:hypothetical protein